MNHNRTTTAARQTRRKRARAAAQAIDAMQRYHADQANALETQRTAARLRQERRAKRITAGREAAFAREVAT